MYKFTSALVQVDILRRMQGRDEALRLLSVYEVQFSSWSKHFHLYPLGTRMLD